VASEWNLNLRYIPGVEREARYRGTLDYRFNPRLTIGLETNGIDEVLPRATWFVTPATERLPSVVIGVTADRLSTPRGHAIFFTFSKALTPNLTPFVSIKYSTDDQLVAFPFGANLTFGSNTLQGLYDGKNTHLIATHSRNGINYNLMLARMRHLGVGISFGF
jgi:hypothetical protein